MASGMTILGGIVGAVAVISAIVFVVMIYNNLVRLRRNIDKAWSNIDVLLKQRSDEIPKLVDTAQQYMSYERDVLQDITQARTEVQKANSPKQKADANNALSGALGNLFAVAEDYPELKANQNFQQLQERISSIEESIADRREFYNDAVNTFNIRINQIPYVIVANMMGYQEKELFEASGQERQDVSIDEQFNS